MGRPGMGLEYQPGSRDFLRTLAPAPRKALRQALQLLAKDPYHEGLDWKVLRTRGADRLLRYRVLKRYRIVVLLRGDRRIVWRIFHRDEGYGWLERAG